MADTVETLAKKMDQLGLWEKLLPFNWAVKVAGTAIPYFCSVRTGEIPLVKVRLLMLEGWQTMHEFTMTKVDRFYGYYSSPIEFPRFELVIATNGEIHLFHYVTGFMPIEANEKQRELALKILWQTYGIMLRIESDAQLPMRYAGEKAMFCRTEKIPGHWEDVALEIPTHRPPVDEVPLVKDEVNQAKDLPFVKDDILDVDFRLLTGLMTNEKVPRTVYQLIGVDPKGGKQLFDTRVSLTPQCSLKELWQTMPSQVVRELIKLGKVPGEIRVKSGRAFRLLRPLCIELPVRLSMHDNLPTL